VRRARALDHLGRGASKLESSATSRTVVSVPWVLAALEFVACIEEP
jgi:hypothetical protein